MCVCVWKEDKGNWSMFNLCVSHPYLTRHTPQWGWSPQLYELKKDRRLSYPCICLVFLNSQMLLPTHVSQTSSWRSWWSRMFVHFRIGWHRSQMSCQNNMKVYWKKRWGWGMAHFKASFMPRRMVLCGEGGEGHYCAGLCLPLALLQGALPVLMREWMVNDRLRLCQSISRGVWPLSLAL